LFVKNQLPFTANQPSSACFGRINRKFKLTRVIESIIGTTVYRNLNTRLLLTSALPASAAAGF
jgi:hypothetical protein